MSETFELKVLALHKILHLDSARNKKVSQDLNISLKVYLEWGIKGVSAKRYLKVLTQI